MPCLYFLSINFVELSGNKHSLCIKAEKMGTKIDYKKLEKEFVTSTISLRALASKHNVAATSVTQYARNHGWKEKRERLAQKSAERQEKQLERVMITRENAWEETTTRMLRILTKKIDELEKGTCDMTYGQLAKAIKDMKEMGMFGLTTTERKNLAEIQKIEKELDTSDENKTVHIVVSEEVSQYGN